MPLFRSIHLFRSPPFFNQHSVALIALIWLLPITAQAKLVAMVVGNEAYGRGGSFQTLSNPIEDAKDMAKLLKEWGFTVTHTTLDADIKTFERDVNQFVERIRKDDTVVYYYSGHGVSSQGANYLIPVPDSRGRGRIQDAADLKYDAINVSQILDKIAQRKPAATIMILDSCRDEMKLQETKGFGSESKGFLSMKATGSLIAYASSPGQSALGGSHYRNSVFTHFFLQQARSPANQGLDIEKLLKKVTVAVYTATDQRQEPWRSTNLRGEYCIGGCRTNPQPVAPAKPTAPKVTAPTINLAALPNVKSEQYPNGDSYIGQFKNGQLHGQGVFYWADGDRYEGEYRDGKKHGQGVYYWAGGKRYEGEFKNDKSNGQGVHYWNSGEFAGDRYEGEFSNWKMHGQGVYYFADGRKRVGTWKDNKLHGPAVFYHADGRRVDQVWENGKLKP